MCYLGCDDTPLPYWETTLGTDDSRTYTVTGMTCAHCVASVSEEISEVRGVSAVDVDLESGRVVVTGDDLNDESIRAAVREAGYGIAS